MNLKKLSVTIVVITMVSIGFGNIISDNAQGAFINNLSGTGLIGGFSSYDVAWNDDGTMAVVAGHEIGNGQNAYAYFPGCCPFRTSLQGSNETNTSNGVIHMAHWSMKDPTLPIV